MNTQKESILGKRVNAKAPRQNVPGEWICKAGAERKSVCNLRGNCPQVHLKQ